MHDTTANLYFSNSGNNMFIVIYKTCSHRLNLKRYLDTKKLMTVPISTNNILPDITSLLYYNIKQLDYDT